MTWEALGALGTIGTFVVITTTAIAALVQLHHVRVANQLNALLTILRIPYDPIQQDARRFISRELPERLKDPQFRRELEEGVTNRDVHKELIVCDYYERIGSFLKNGLVDPNTYLDASSPELTWRQLEPVISIARRKRGPVVYENFEYLIALSREWDRLHQTGNYPRRVPGLTYAIPGYHMTRQSGRASRT